MNRNICRGDIYLADLDPVKGSEQGGKRPVLIIQNNTGNYFSPTVIVAAITSKKKPDIPTHLPINCFAKLNDGSIVLFEQIRTLDKSRLGDFIDNVGPSVLRRVDTVLAVSLGIKLRRSEPIVMTLCPKCRSRFEAGGFNVRLLGDPRGSKDTCMFCNNKQGFDYEVERV